jgi:V/A-type H+/Na+-transporting ATPase subunit E
MNADQVVEKILSQAREEAKKITAAAHEAAQKENQRLEKETADYRRDTNKLAEAAGQDKLSRMLAASRMQNAKDILSAKGRILDELFARVKQRVEQLPDNEYLELMKRLLQKCVQSGHEEVIIGKNEARINQAFINKVNTEAKSDLRLSEIREDIGGGFILSSGKVRINSSTDVLVNQLRDKMEMELAAELFR